MKIEPATFAQVRRGRDGRRITITEDVGDIAKQISEIDPRLGLQWNEKGGFFMVVEYAQLPDGIEERLIFTAQECDHRIVKRMQQITHPSYDFMAEVEAMDKEADKEKDRRFKEQTGEAAERLAHAVRRDIQAKNKAFIND